MLRYRLYDLDRIITRTLAYGLLTVLLGGGYAVVLGLGQVLARGRSLVVAIATLAVAAAFQPARHRVQTRTGSTAASTAAATTPPRPSRRSPRVCASRSTWRP